MMYCMPQVGTRVSLYFPNCDEQAAIAVNCVRTNGSSCARMSDPSKRSFVTEHGKEMNLYPQEMSLLGGANGTVKLEDEAGITVSTDKKIRIIAKQSVLVNGKTLAVAAPAGELVLAKGNALSGSIESSVIQSSQYDLLAALHTHMEGWNQQTFEAYDDAPQEGSFDWGGLIGNVLAGLAAVAAVAFIVGTAGLGAPVVVGAIAVGSTAVIGQALSDYASGTVSSTETYIITGLLGAVAGAVSGGVGAMIEGAIPAGATALAKMGIVGSSGVLETLIENTIMGQRTTGTDMAFAFVASAGLFGIGDNLIPILNQVRRGGQAVGDMLGSAGRSIDNALNSAARQAGDTLDSISKELCETVDDLLRKLENAFPSPNRPRYAMAGGPADFVEDIDEPFDTVVNSVHRIDADTPRETDIDAPPKGAGEGQRIPDQSASGDSITPHESGSGPNEYPSAKGLVGHDFEAYLHQTIGGESQYIKGSTAGRDFDGVFGTRWYEAKSGNYWNKLLQDKSIERKFKQKMAEGLKIAQEHGATYELFSNTPIPDSIKEWLTKKGIPFTEILD